jgi:outer membrane lipoprotein SlyB
MISKAEYRLIATLMFVALAGTTGTAMAQYYQYPTQYQYQYPQYNYQYQQYGYQYPQYQQQPAAQSQYYNQYQQQYAPAQTATAYQGLPSYCLHNNAAAGAAMGSLMGAAIGGAVGGGRGALIGAGSGLLFGGLSGAQADAQCQQLAVQQAYQAAAAQQAAIEQQLAQQAASQSGALTLPASAYQPVSTDYQTPSNGHRHRVTVKRLNTFSDPATRQLCDTFTKIDADFDSNTSNTSTARRCKGADGQWHDAV